MNQNKQNVFKRVVNYFLQMCERKKKLTQGQQLTEEEIIRKKRILAMEKLSQGNELEAEQAESTLIE